jgi:hypothetical protein
MGPNDMRNFTKMTHDRELVIPIYDLSLTEVTTPPVICHETRINEYINNEFRLGDIFETPKEVITKKLKAAIIGTDITILDIESCLRKHGIQLNRLGEHVKGIEPKSSYDKMTQVQRNIIDRFIGEYFTPSEGAEIKACDAFNLWREYKTFRPVLILN